MSALFPCCDICLVGIRQDIHWILFHILIYVCAIKVEGYITFLDEGSMYTRYEYIFCACRGLYNSQIREHKIFKFFFIFQPTNAIT